jgi:drug/metabolite transporter, DME family
MTSPAASSATRVDRSGRRQPTAIPLRGSLLAVFAAFVWSFGALVNRWSTDSDAWQYLLWRSIGIIVGTQIVALIRHDAPPVMQAWRSGWLMIGANFGLLGASLGFVYALKNTTAANASFFASLSPFVAAAVSYFWLKEPITRATMCAMVLAGIGLLVLAFGPTGGSQGDGLAPSLRGNIAALLSSIGFATYVLCIRRAPNNNWSPVMPGYSSMLVALCLMVVVANGNKLAPSLRDIGMAVFHGGVIIVVGTSIFNHATKSVPSVALAVLAQVETIAVPFLVFLAFREVPSPAAMIGGTIILGAVVLQAIGQSRGGRAVPLLAAEAERGV